MNENERCTSSCFGCCSDDCESYEESLTGDRGVDGLVDGLISTMFVDQARPLTADPPEKARAIATNDTLTKCAMPRSGTGS